MTQLFKNADITEKFVIVVREYIELIGKLESISAFEFLNGCAVLLPQIYTLGLLLLDVEPVESSDSAEDKYLERYEVVSSIISKTLREYNVYSEVFDPVYEKDSIQITLSDDLADIYMDLIRPLMDYDSGDSLRMKSPIWDWKFNIRGHCGDHIVDALRPIHRLVFDHLSPDF